MMHVSEVGTVLLLSSQATGSHHSMDFGTRSRKRGLGL